MPLRTQTESLLYTISRMTNYALLLKWRLHVSNLIGSNLGYNTMNQFLRVALNNLLLNTVFHKKNLIGVSHELGRFFSPIGTLCL